ncbi:MAG: DUF393 domain-containing protein [Pirellulales bacterium]|nr:DUF393 domain-containing protein [Pirellulales bacterium]
MPNRELNFDLPDPDVREQADVVIYDDSCRLCRDSAELLNRLDWWGRLAFLPLQDPRIGRMYADLTLDELEQHIYVIDSHGRRRKGADAVRYLTRHLAGLWILAPLLHIPGSMPVWRWLYAEISRRRHGYDK